jgi:hypothetical protein
MSHMARSQIARCNQTNSGRSGASVSARSISSRDFPGVPSPESGCASQAAVARLSGVACATRTSTSRSRSARRCDKPVPLARVAVHPLSPHAPRMREIDHFASNISLDFQLLVITHIQFLQQHVTHLALKTRPFWIGNGKACGVHLGLRLVYPFATWDRRSLLPASEMLANVRFGVVIRCTISHYNQLADRALHSIKQIRARPGAISPNSLYTTLRTGSCLPSVALTGARFTLSSSDWRPPSPIVFD